MLRRWIVLAIIGTLFCGVQAVSGAPGAAGYRLKGSDIVLPPGVPLGQYRRIFQPFPNWTLVCDENLKTRQVVCNVSQTVIDTKGRQVFSWSLASEEGGQSDFILRTLPDADTQAGIELQTVNMAGPIRVAFQGCNQKLCLGTTPVAGPLSEEIERGSSIVVTYHARNGEVRAYTLPLKGLKEAIASSGRH